jgi:hypothetical protein
MAGFSIASMNTTDFTISGESPLQKPTVPTTSPGPTADTIHPSPVGRVSTANDWASGQPTPSGPGPHETSVASGAVLDGTPISSDTALPVDAQGLAVSGISMAGFSLAGMTTPAFTMSGGSPPGFTIAGGIPSGFTIASLSTPFRPSLDSAVQSRIDTPCPTAGVKRHATDSMGPPAKKRKLPHSVSASVASAATSTKSKRDRKFGDKLKQRSGLRCELSGITKVDGFFPEGAHIFGLATGADERANWFWEVLYLFWPGLAVDALRETCRKYINHMANGISMDVKAHRLWDELEFYLEVLDDSYQVSGNKAQYSVKIRFPRSPVTVLSRWLPWTRMPSGRTVPMVFADGDEIIFKTDNYHDFPLPDPNLLKLRALLTKCCFLKAAGESQDAYDLRQEHISGELRASPLNYGDYTFSDGSDSAEGYSDYSDVYEWESEETSFPGKDSSSYVEDHVIGDDIEDSGLRVESWLDNIGSKLVEGDGNEDGELASQDGHDDAPHQLGDD